VSAIALFVFMFFSWYGYEQTGNLLSYVGLAGFDGDAWHSLEAIRWYLLLPILFALGTALLPVLDPDRDPAVGPSAGVAVFGGLATLLIVLRIVAPPDFDRYADLPVRFTVELGAYLGLAAAVGIAFGGYRSMRERGGSFAQVADALAKPKRAPKPKSSRSPRPARSASRRRSRSSSD
jgi:hypothetical protein